jgi:short chain dehydrogenase
MFATNVTGLINMTQEVLKVYKTRDEGGRGDIINIGSIAGREAYPGGSIYCATKAAVRSFTDALRRELISTRIRVIELDPGQVETEFSMVRFYGDKSKADAVYANCEPLTPDDIAEAVVFTAGRRENVVIADMMLYPSHQVGWAPIRFFPKRPLTNPRRVQHPCTRSLHNRVVIYHRVPKARLIVCESSLILTASTEHLSDVLQILRFSEVDDPPGFCRVLHQLLGASVKHLELCITRDRQVAEHHVGYREATGRLAAC